MRISKFIRVLRISVVPVLFSAAALGLVAAQVSLQRKAERAKSRAAQEMLVQDSVLPDKTVSLKFRDLSAAAEKGDLPARIEIGRRLMQGLGVRKNESRAASYFQAIINDFGEISARDKRGPHVAAAFRYMARLYKAGVVEAKIAANPAYAFSLLHHAASYFGDPASQVELAKLLINGEGVTKNPRAGAQWLLNASRKGYAPAQALLGEMLWHGNGVKRVAGDGLGLLAIARRNASADDKDWVSKMFESARSEALPIEILEANAFVVQESSVSRFGLKSDIVISGEGSDATAVVEAGSAGARSPAGWLNGQQGALVQGPSPSWSELRANPMALVPNTYDPELPLEKKGAETSTGTMQMYHPGGLDVRSENSSPVRYAGVSK
jgi:uncharacterized protein